MVKYAIALSVALFTFWMLWSGHTEPFMLFLGAGSCGLVVLICWRMEILDRETVPISLGIRPFTRYAPWLIKSIVKANVDVSLRIVRRKMPIQPQMIEIRPLPRTELGRVILANSITLTPGTVSVDLQDNRILVHALSDVAADEDATGEMNRRVQELEGRD